MSQSWFQRAKKPVDTYETHCENARERPTRNGTGTPYYIYRHKGPYVKGKILIILRCTENAPATTSLMRCRHTTQTTNLLRQHANGWSWLNNNQSHIEEIVKSALDPASPERCRPSQLSSPSRHYAEKTRLLLVKITDQSRCRPTLSGFWLCLFTPLKSTKHPSFKKKQ